MESLKEITEKQQGQRPKYFNDPQKDHLVALILELTEEICVLRDRLDTSEILARQGKPVTKETIEAYQPEDALQDERLAQHTRLHERILRKMLNDKDQGPLK